MGKFIKLIIIVIVLGMSVNAGNFVNGQVSQDLNDQIKELNDNIQAKKDQIDKIQERQSQYSNAIKETQGQKASLNNQLAILDNRVAKAELDIESVQAEIDRTNLEIKKTDLEINNQNVKIESEKSDIANVLRVMYRGDRVSTLEILLLNNSLAEFLAQAQYLEDLDKEVADHLDSLKKMKVTLEKERASLDDQNKQLSLEKGDLEKKKTDLESEKQNKAIVISQLNVSESEYQRLLAQAKKEQEDAAAEIASTEKLVRAKIAQMNGAPLDFNDNGFIWPVPKNTITAYFHDPDYPFRYVFEHPAVDIRAAQATPIKAALSGYVAMAHDGGMGYSYIMLVHSDNLATVYGHVSKISVKNDDYVVQGQVIGYSGGLPGTPGAGPLTTGPHLHFEVRLNGIPVDPLAYLP